MTVTGNSHGDTSRSVASSLLLLPWLGAVSLSKGNRITPTLLTKAWGSQSIQTGWRVSPDTQLSTARGPAPGQGAARVPSPDGAWGQRGGACPVHLLLSQLAACRACGTCSQRPLPYVQATKTRDVSAKPFQPSRHWPRPLPQARGLPQWPLMSRGHWRSCGFKSQSEGIPQSLKVQMSPMTAIWILDGAKARPGLQ